MQWQSAVALILYTVTRCTIHSVTVLTQLTTVSTVTVRRGTYLRDVRCASQENNKDRTTMINDKDLRAIRDSACVAWGLTIAVIVVVYVIVSVL